MADQESEIDRIKAQLISMELRLRRLESALAYSEPKREIRLAEEAQNHERKNVSEYPAGEEKGLESRIGRFGLAWMGNIVLLFGITFMTQYLMNLNHQILAALLGYIASASILFVSGYLKKTNNHLSFIFKLTAQVLLFYMTLRLHFFASDPLIVNKHLAMFLLLVIVAFETYLSIRNKSQALGALAIMFLFTAATTGDTALYNLTLLIVAATGAVIFLLRFEWKPLFPVTMLLSYTGLILWIIGNPVMGHPVKLIAERYPVVICLFSLGAVYSAVLWFRAKDSISGEYLIGVTITNGLLFTLLLLFLVLSFFSAGYVALFVGITLCCLIYSIILHARSDWNFASAFYALYGFMAMSIAMYGFVGLPKVYLLLSFQSLIVVSMALWFRNKLIVVMNSLLFLTILAIYLLSSQTSDGVNFSFALVALVSARIINWQSSRLKIQTDLIRNLYMTEGFIMVLYALIHAVPKQFVTLSWTMAALLYFLISILLKNVKYRYMALGTMICAAFYLFIVDLARIEIVYRVLALLFLAAISIGISIYYTNRIKKSDS
jgi:hypothetical protein